MDNFQKDIIGIIKAALLNEKYNLPEDFDFDSAVKLAKKHGIIVMFYYGLLNCGVDESQPFMQQLFMIVCQNIAINERQMYSINEIFDAFDKANIDYMPLKGTLLKKLYPKPEIRSMGDSDILIKIDQYDSIKTIMSNLAFVEHLENDHELSWKKNSVLIELHKKLIPSYNKDFFSYFGDGWKFAKIKDGTRYSMTDEDQMIYLFTHYVKHYRDAGIGLRHIVDLWVYRNSKPNLNENYIKIELEKLNLYKFYLNTIKTLNCWFEDAQEDSVTNFITDFIFNNGVYGIKDSHSSWETLKLSKNYKSTLLMKIHKIIVTAFLPYEYMCIVFPVLKKVPFLLPFFWIYRGFKAILFKQSSIKKNINNLNIYNLDAAKKHEIALNFVGLDCNFKE